MDVWPEIEAERKELLTLLESLPEEQWNTPTLCDKWRVRDVVGHLIGATQATVGAMFTGALGKGFRINRFLAEDAVKRGSVPTSELLEQFRAAIPTRRLPPGLKTQLGLVDTVVHQQDIRRPLGVPRAIPTERFVAVADVLKGLSVGLGAKRRIRGLRLEATDADWAIGEGPKVAGPLEALVLTMAGRRAGLDDLEGEGKALLAART